ncbi:29750_t:CDS:2 [Gigaspora margarita]|uniref:29750_t:CDS:1 n=1 Tax=Gigaspora margarita TaxID=4874 RepID=A0ABN7UM87_GIGMA|nr:29750_t:CDS:2 [Gigaspora margarita]
MKRKNLVSTTSSLTSSQLLNNDMGGKSSSKNSNNKSIRRLTPIPPRLRGKAATFVTVAEPKDLDEAITKARKAEAENTTVSKLLIKAIRRKTDPRYLLMKPGARVHVTEKNKGTIDRPYCPELPIGKKPPKSIKAPTTWDGLNHTAMTQKPRTRMKYTPLQKNSTSSTPVVATGKREFRPNSEELEKPGYG